MKSFNPQRVEEIIQRLGEEGGDLDTFVHLPDTRVYELVGRDNVAIWLMGRLCAAL